MTLLFYVYFRQSVNYFSLPASSYTYSNTFRVSNAPQQSCNGDNYYEEILTGKNKTLEFFIIDSLTRDEVSSFCTILCSHWVSTDYCAICGYMLCAINFSRGFWYGTLPYPFTFKRAKLLTISTSAVKWYKSHVHN